MMLSFLAVAAGCRMQEEAEVEKSGPAVRFVARTDALTRTVFGEPDGKTYPTYWSGDETVGISLNYDWAEEVDITVNESRTRAEFSYAPEGTAAVKVVSEPAASAVPSTKVISWVAGSL